MVYDKEDSGSYAYGQSLILLMVSQKNDFTAGSASIQSNCISYISCPMGEIIIQYARYTAL